MVFKSKKYWQAIVRGYMRTNPKLAEQLAAKHLAGLSTKAVVVMDVKNKQAATAAALQKAVNEVTAAKARRDGFQSCACLGEAGVCAATLRSAGARAKSVPPVVHAGLDKAVYDAEDWLMHHPALLRMAYEDVVPSAIRRLKSFAVDLNVA